jgi:dihydroflavonol-4-reductase
VKALVIGGTGFIGMNLIRSLLRAGHDVVATRREHTNTLFARKLGAPLVVADLEDEEALYGVMRGREVVFMCAGHYPRYSLDHAGEVAVARRRAAASLRAAARAGVGRYVLTSSVATVGPPEPPRTLARAEDPMDPRALASVYYATKSTIEREARGAEQKGLDVVILCPTGVMGELDVKAGTGALLVGLATGRLKYYVEGFTNIVDADVVAEAHLRAAERGRRGARYLVAGHNVTIGGLLREAAHELGVALRARRLPLIVARWLSSLDERRCARQTPPGRPMLAREFIDMARFGHFVDGSASRKELGLGPEPPLSDTLQKAIGWYARHRYFTLPGRAFESSIEPGSAPRPARPDPAVSLGDEA